jgi:hypothetical protein
MLSAWHTGPTFLFALRYRCLDGTPLRLLLRQHASRCDIALALGVA